MFVLSDHWLPLTVLLAAVALDLAFGEPPTPLHPVAWMGTLTAQLERYAPRSGRLRQLVVGTLIAIAVPSLFTAVVWYLLSTSKGHIFVRFIVGALLLKPMFALQALGKAAFAVRDALHGGNLAQARFGLRSLCSRNPSDLDEPALVAATIESVAENSSDSFVAPLFYYVLLGLPGAVFYRAVNTLDAMIGYHGRYEYLGKSSARLDDVLNYIPSRITAVVLLFAGALCGHDVQNGLAILVRDGSQTQSPNAGRPMAAMAGLLRVGLEKKGYYHLGDAIEPLDTTKIDQAWRIVCIAAAIAVVISAVTLGMRHETFE